MLLSRSQNGPKMFSPFGFPQDCPRGPRFRFESVSKASRRRSGPDPSRPSCPPKRSGGCPDDSELTEAVALRCGSIFWELLPLLLRGKPRGTPPQHTFVPSMAFDQEGRRNTGSSPPELPESILTGNFWEGSRMRVCSGGGGSMPPEWYGSKLSRALPKTGAGQLKSCLWKM